MQSFDVLIVGGGITGLTLAAALADSQLSVGVIEPRPPTPLHDQELRVSALHLGSQRVFETLGVWQAMVQERLSPYSNMQVWEKDSFGQIAFDAEQVHQSHLGHIVENRNIQLALWQTLKGSDKITLLTESPLSTLAVGQQEAVVSLENGALLSARLVVGADGGRSKVREIADFPLTFWDYQHHALVATVKTELAHGQTARQIFSPESVLAFLPLKDPHQCSIVWSMPADDCRQQLVLSDNDFNKALTAAFDAKLGLVEVASTRQSFPLSMRFSRRWVTDRIAVIGDAAHTIHPLAGQGANLGIMDAAALAQNLIELQGQSKDIGLAANLRRFERWRKAEAATMAGVMEGFKRLYAGANPVKKLIRDIGMSTVDKLAPLKTKIIRQAMGLEGQLPELAKSDPSVRSE